MGTKTVEERTQNNEQVFYETYSFGNVHLRVHPNGEGNVWNVFFENFSNVLLNVVVNDRLRTITCPKRYSCKGITYNEGFLRYLCCGNNGKCAAVNPDITDHVKMGFELWHRANWYSKTRSDSKPLCYSPDLA